MQAVSDQGVPPAVPSSTAEGDGVPAGPGWADLDPSQRSALVSWLAFTATFATVRGITYSIRAGRGPFRNFSLGGEHLHHYLWGIGLLAGVGAVAVRGDEHLRQHRYRITGTDHEYEERADVLSDPPPEVSHLIAVDDLP